MKVKILTILVILSVGYSNAASVCDRCQQLTDFASRVNSKLSEILQPRDWLFIIETLNKGVGFDIRNSTAREIVLCKIAAATNQREFYDAIPRTGTGPRHYRYDEYLTKRYNMIQQEIAGHLGGYTNIGRLVNLAKDVDEWANQQNPGRTLREKTDLATLTDFLKVLQVKYGSRAFSFFVGKQNQGFLVTDPEELAKKLYEGDISAIEEYTGLDISEAGKLIRFLTGMATKADSDIFELWSLAVEGLNLVGDMGLLTLKP